MKAVILAAGRGSRLGARTETIPKPMLPFKGKPILEHNIELCKQYGIRDIYINTHHLAHVITDYFGNGQSFGVSINYSFEHNLLGTAGALQKFKDQLGSSPFFVIYGDNVSLGDLERLKQAHLQHNPYATIAFHHRNDISMSGVAEFNEHYKITKFIEKPSPSQTTSHWVNAGIYCLDHRIFEYIPEGFSDFGKDIFPTLLKQNFPLYGLCQTETVFAFDTEELFAKSREEE